MNIELRNIKHFKSETRETMACTANVYVDGKKVGYIENSGRGEPYCPLGVSDDVMKSMAAWTKAQPPVQSPYGEFPYSLELHFGLLIQKDLVRGDAKRLFSSRVCYVTPDGQISHSGRMSKDALAKIHFGQIKVDESLGARLVRSEEELFELMLK